MNRKIGSLIAAAVTAASLAVYAGAADIPVARLGSKIELIQQDDGRAAVLKSSRSVKNTLVVESGEILAVNSGCTLTLKAGCRVDGLLYIAPGGKVAVSGGNMMINGQVLCEGTLSAAKNGGIYVEDGGTLYVSDRGRLSLSGDRFGLGDMASAAVFGKTSFKSEVPEIIRGALSAKVAYARSSMIDVYFGAATDSRELTAQEALELASAAYYTRSEFPAGGSHQLLTMVFDNGRTLSMTLLDGMIIDIGGASVTGMVELLGDMTEYPG